MAGHLTAEQFLLRAKPPYRCGTTHLQSPGKLRMTLSIAKIANIAKIAKIESASPTVSFWKRRQYWRTRSGLQRQ
jgi:hypothetical protein